MNVPVGLKPFVKPTDRGSSQYATVEQIEQLMGLEPESISPLAWLVMQEEASGVKSQDIATTFGVAEDDLSALRDKTTGLDGADSINLWLQGVFGLMAIKIVNEQNIGSGWDAIEAIAVDKVARTLNSMKGAGNMMELMQIANLANKAVRRNIGEGTVRNGARGQGPGTNVSVTLPSGHVGVIQLTLAPAIRQQLSNPTRVIDQVRNEGNMGTRGVTKDLAMLSLKETRELPEPLPEGTTVVDGMRFDSLE